MVERHGFHVSKVLPMTTVFRNVIDADQILGLYRVTERAIAPRYIKPDAARVWLDSLANATFFASVTLFLTVAFVPTKPEAQAGTKSWDKALLAVILPAMVAVLPVAALDAGRFHWSAVPAWVLLSGYVD
ncbi:hypothetical protein EV129_1264 [Rhizobium azibense]|uniref:Uncharacterized protein n=2 Tax=Rhizobium azibense TaxID=1136135 RepID=A0A4R3RDX0_9HYPH|nr:hypothetical protein EV129_1264 [Rhizobium azibense]